MDGWEGREQAKRRIAKEYYVSMKLILFLHLSLSLSFVSSAVQQSKVKLSWDETDPNRVRLTQRK